MEKLFTKEKSLNEINSLEFSFMNYRKTELDISYHEILPAALTTFILRVLKSFHRQGES